MRVPRTNDTDREGNAIRSVSIEMNPNGDRPACVEVHRAHHFRLPSVRPEAKCQLIGICSTKATRIDQSA